MKVLEINDFAVLVGIDWADKKHDVCEHPLGTIHYHYSIISNKPESLHGWATSLKKRYPKQSIAVACELTKGPLIYALSKYNHLHSFRLTFQRSQNIAKRLSIVVQKMTPVMLLSKQKYSNNTCKNLMLFGLSL